MRSQIYNRKVLAVLVIGIFMASSVAVLASQAIRLQDANDATSSNTSDVNTTPNGSTTNPTESNPNVTSSPGEPTANPIFEVAKTKEDAQRQIDSATAKINEAETKLNNTTNTFASQLVDDAKNHLSKATTSLDAGMFDESIAHAMIAESFAATAINVIDVQTQASQSIDAAEAKLTQAETELIGMNGTLANELLDEGKSHLEMGKTALNEGKPVEAMAHAMVAEEFAITSIELAQNQKVGANTSVVAKIVGNSALIKVSMRFITNSTDMNAIAQEILTRMKLTRQQIASVLQIESSERLVTTITTGSTPTEVNTEFTFPVTTNDQDQIAIDAAQRLGTLTIEEIARSLEGQFQPTSPSTPATPQTPENITPTTPEMPGMGSTPENTIPPVTPGTTENTTPTPENTTPATP